MSVRDQGKGGRSEREREGIRSLGCVGLLGVNK